MHILLLTHYFPPESNAPANRAVDHALAWTELGHRVTIVTAHPSHPAGKLYPGYENKFSREKLGAIDVIRLKTYLAANAGIFARSFAFLSFFLAVAYYRRRLPKSDVVISTSPQFFSGLAGWLLTSKSTPWVLEIRDLWPESILAVGAMRRNILIRALEALEKWAYKKADLIVTTTHAHRRAILKKCSAGPVVVIPNGYSPSTEVISKDAHQQLRANLGITGQLVLTYLGTHGMAHGLDAVLDAAARTSARKDIFWLLVGDGADLTRLKAQQAERKLTNLAFLGQKAREDIPLIWDVSDVAIVHLRKSKTFLSVLPSKMIEAMAMRKPVILGVQGEAAELLVKADGGLLIEPENGLELAQAAMKLADDRSLVTKFGNNGFAYTSSHFNRSLLAKHMIDAIDAIL